MPIVCLNTCFVGVEDLCDTVLSTSRVTEDTSTREPVLKLHSVQWQGETDMWEKRRNQCSDRWYGSDHA